MVTTRSNPPRGKRKANDDVQDLAGQVPKPAIIKPRKATKVKAGDSPKSQHTGDGEEEIAAPPKNVAVKAVGTKKDKAKDRAVVGRRAASVATEDKAKGKAQQAPAEKTAGEKAEKRAANEASEEQVQESIEQSEDKLSSGLNEELFGNSSGSRENTSDPDEVRSLSGEVRSESVSPSERWESEPSRWALINALCDGPLDSDQEIFGFENAGALCYRNALMAALLNCEVFMAYLANWHLCYQSPAMEEYIDFDVFKEIYQVGQTCLQYEGKNGRQKNSHQKYVEKAMEVFWRCSNLKSDRKDGVSIGWTSWSDSLLPTFDRKGNPTDPATEQQDIAEFMVWLLNQARTQLEAIPRIQEPEVGAFLPIDVFNFMFRVRKTQRRTCSECKQRFRTSNIEEAWSLNVHLASIQGESETSPTLTDLLEKSLVDEREVMCKNCGRNTVMEYTQKLYDTPEMLFVGLQRLNPLDDTKYETRVEIPEILDVTDWLEPRRENASGPVQYRLSSVVGHKGTKNSGHWITSVRDRKTPGEWKRLNDKVVTSCRLNDFNDSDRTKGLARRLARHTPQCAVYERVHPEADYQRPETPTSTPTPSPIFQPLPHTPRTHTPEMSPFTILSAGKFPSQGTVHAHIGIGGHDLGYRMPLPQGLINAGVLDVGVSIYISTQNPETGELMYWDIMEAMRTAQATWRGVPPLAQKKFVSLKGVLSGEPPFARIGSVDNPISKEDGKGDGEEDVNINEKTSRATSQKERDDPDA